jgi:YD repeat-containing protein
MSAPAVRLVGGLVAALVLLFATSPLSAQPTIQYAYDALGRLIAVVDQNGNVGVYNYDAVGNLLSIQRVDGSGIPGAVGITLVVPNKGKAGTTVLIFGKGFSATTSQNTVSFNGTSAAVAAATTSSLTTSVPSGAVSGPITVSTPLGTATSSTAFAVIGAIAVSPATATLSVNGAQQFTAQEAGTPTTNVNWAVNAIVGGNQTVGTITTAGLYTGPPAPPPLGTVTVTATSKDDVTASGSATVTILTPQQAFVVSGSLSVGLNQVPQAFDKNVTARVSVGVNQVPQTFDKSVTGTVSVRVASTDATAVARPVTVTVGPVITSVSPPNGARGSVDLAVTVTGSGLADATSLAFLLNNTSDPNVTVTGLTASPDGTQATATISIGVGAAVGGRVMQITTLDGTSTAAGTGGDIFTVQ